MKRRLFRYQFSAGRHFVRLGDLRELLKNCGSVLFRDPEEKLDKLGLAALLIRFVLA